MHTPHARLRTAALFAVLLGGSAGLASAQDAATPATPALSDFDNTLQRTFGEMCATAKERQGQFCDALVALIGKRQAAGIAIVIHEPAGAKKPDAGTPAAGKSPAGAKPGAKAGAASAPATWAQRWGLLAEREGQPQFLYRSEPQRKQPASPEQGLVWRWTVPGVEVAERSVRDGQEREPNQLFRWNASRDKVIGIPLDSRNMFLDEIAPGPGGVTVAVSSRPDNSRIRTIGRALSDGGTEWSYESFKDGAWAPTQKDYYAPRTQEWIAKWQQEQQRIAQQREQERLAAEQSQRAFDALMAQMEAEERAYEQQQAEEEAEQEAERQQLVARWDAMKAANEQALAESIANANASAARNQAMLDAHHRQLQYEQQAQASGYSQRDVEDARQATERQYEIARQYEAQQRAQREAQAQREAALQLEQQRAQAERAATASYASGPRQASTHERLMGFPGNTCADGRKGAQRWVGSGGSFRVAHEIIEANGSCLVQIDLDSVVHGGGTASGQ